MNVTVLWSGGFDSTALAYHHLDQGDEVQLLSVRLANNSEQARAEKYARKWIGELMDEEFKRTILRTEVDWPLVHAHQGRGGFDLPQPPLWLLASAFNASYLTISAGWVKGDDVWHHKSDLFDVISALNKFREASSPLSLVTPFEWMTKSELVSHFRRRPLVFQLLSSSERGTPWTLGSDKKCEELQKLCAELRATGPFDGIGPPPQREAEKVEAAAAAAHKQAECEKAGTVVPEQAVAPR